VLRALAYLDDGANDPRVKYMPAYLKSMWSPTDPRMKHFREIADRMRQFYKHSVELTRTMHQAGVGILAGTDTSNPFCFPGFSLHDELELLVKAGLMPLEALQSATYNPAKYLDLEKNLGTVEQGKFADLVLLDANPLDNISNTKKIAGVIVRGKAFDSESLKKMLADVEAEVNKK
jgi:imidazolonepropionase-like amidohydrolase